jgi:hypothetical protein
MAADIKLWQDRQSVTYGNAAFTFLQWKRWMQKLYGLLKLPWFHVAPAFEIVVGAEVSGDLKDFCALSDSSI